MFLSLRFSQLWRGCWVLLGLLLGCLPAKAVHLLGGELTYKYLDANGPADKPWRYELTLRTYYNPTTDPSEQPLIIRVYTYSNGYSGQLLETIGVRRLSTTPIVLPTVPGCGPPPPPAALALYVTVVNLPATGGSFLAECGTGDRLAGIANLVNSERTGITLNAVLTPGTIPNSSPVFTSVPIPLLCLGTPTLVLNNAYDADGDQLEYSLGTPLPEKVYNPLTYAPGYSPTQPFGPTGSVALDPSTGATTYLSTAQGIFQLAIDVREYRVINGQRTLLSTVHRDQQVVVRACGTAPGRPPAFTAATLAKTAFQIQEGQPLTFDVAATDPDGDPLTLTASSILLDGPGGIDASFGGQPGSSTGVGPLGQASVRGTGTAAATFRLAGCGLNRRQPYEVVVTATDEVCNRQSVVATFLITVTQPPFTGSVAGKNRVCAQSTSTYTVTTGTPGPYYWEATGGQLLGPATGPSVQVLWGAPGTGVVRVGGISSTGCPTQLVAYPVVIGPGLAVSGPTTYCLNGASGLRYTVAGPAGAYQWSITDGTILSGQGTSEVLLDIRPGATATLQVSNAALSACTTTLLISPDDNCLAFYNVITPNGDQKNDLFVIKNLERHPGTALTVFNRWGRQVYHSDDYLNTYDGEGSSAGLYYYRCLLSDGTTYKGWFELIR